MKKFFQRSHNSMSARFIKVYSLILIVTFFIFTATVIVSVSFYLLYHEKQSIDEIRGEFEKTAQSGDVDWQQTLDELVFYQYPYHVISVEDQSGNEFHTPNYEEFFAEDDEVDLESDSVINLSFLPSIYFHGEEGIYYKDTFTISNEAEVTVYAPLEPIAEFIETMIVIIFIIGGVTIVVGVAFIYFTTKRNTRPILELTASVGKVDYKNHLGEGVTVPSTPQEVADLAESFNKLLSELDRYVEQEKMFVSNASHELRTPVGAIRGNANLIKRRGAEHPEVIEPSINAIYEETIRMEKIINQLLDMSRNENYTSEKEVFDVSGVVTETCAVFSEVTSVDIAENIQMIGNAEQIRQVLVILLDNAKKYVDEDGEINVSLAEDYSQISITVSDNGIGIPENEVDQIFKRFYRVDEARARSTGGAGLGLSLARMIVEQHGGTIRAESELEMGTCFILKFPKY